jgi:hypothetical protein
MNHQAAVAVLNVLATAILIAAAIAGSLAF